MLHASSTRLAWQAANLCMCLWSHVSNRARRAQPPATDATEYRSIVGSLRYLVNTCLDLAYSVGYVSRFMEKPTTEHLSAVKRVLRYTAGTLNDGCRYVKNTGVAQLIDFRDSDMAGDLD